MPPSDSRASRRKELPDHVTYDHAQSSLPRVLVWTLALVGIPSPKRRDLRQDRGPGGTDR
jgi:hypothetical protein